MKALMISGICHSVDHLGCSNYFLQETEHYLTKIYDDSYIENNTYYVALLLLQVKKIAQLLI